MVEQEAVMALAPARTAYDAAKASQAFAVKVEPVDTDVPKVLAEWLRGLE
jgi:hypothetical protein